MSKTIKKQSDLPQLPQKYINEKKIEESEKKLNEDKTRFEKLIFENTQLQLEIKQRESDAVKSIIAYNMKFEEQQIQLKNFEKQNSQYKLDIETIREETTQIYTNKIAQIKEDFDKKINLLVVEVSSEKERAEEYRNKKNEYKTESIELKKERDRLNETLISTIKKYEDLIRDQKRDYESQITQFRIREDEYIKQKESLSENEIYDVYKDLKKTFEKNLYELREFKETNNKITDENKIFKLSLDTSDGILKECAKIQLQKQKIINQYKDNLEYKSTQLSMIKDNHEEQIKDLTDKFNEIINNLNKELNHYKNKTEMLLSENKKLKQLSQIILDQRNEVEIYFLESLEEIKLEIYKKKKGEQKKKSLFPSLGKKYEIKNEAISKFTVKDLTAEDKEKMLKILFNKINENRKCKSYIDYSINKELVVSNDE